MTRSWTLVASAVALAVLQACGGGGGGDDNGVPPASFPVLSANVYRGVANPGELVELTLDPAAKTYSLVVVSSQFGVSSTPYTGSYREVSGRLVDTVDSSITFIVANGQAYGNFKVTTGAGATLNIAMVGTNQIVTEIGDLAGFYSHVQLTASPTGSDAQANSGQMKIATGGSIRVCEAAGYSDTCKNLEGQDVIMQLVHVGNGRWNIKSGDFKLADFYPRRVDGITSFLIDYSFTDDTGPRVGMGVVVSDRDLVAGSFDGAYDCFSRGSTFGLTVSGASATGSDGSTYSFTYNRGGSMVDGQWRTFNAGALVEAAMSGVAAPRGRMVITPLSAKELAGSGVDIAGTVFTFACIRP